MSRRCSLVLVFRRRATMLVASVSFIAVIGMGLVVAAPTLANAGRSSARSAGAGLATSDLELATFDRLALSPFLAPPASNRAEAENSPNDEAVTDNEPVTCTGCSPPLTYHGGPTLGTTAQAGAITITPIYWSPSGLGAFPAGYVPTVSQYLTDIAAASGSTTNVFAVNQEYSRASTGAGSGDQIKYSITAGTPITDTTAYPANASGTCTISAAQSAAGITTCVTDASVQAELSADIAANDPNRTGLGYVYSVFVPPGVEIISAGGQYSVGAWCGIHGSFTGSLASATGPIVYFEEPYPVSGCTGSEWPQYFASGPNQYQTGTADADSEVSTLSHETDEAITDPQYGNQYGWFDGTGNEIGDDCAWIFGAPAGSTTTVASSNSSYATYAQQSEYNQVINGHDYWTQESFSDATFAAFKIGQGCVQQAFRPQGSADPTQPAPDLGTGVVSADPVMLPADGSSTSTVTDTVSRQDGEPVVGDDVEFNVDTANGSTGTCGTLSDGTTDTGETPSFALDAMTDADGQATVTYTASTDGVACDVIATEAQGGTTDTATINQGASAMVAPTITADNLPTSVTAGASTPVTFTTTATNPGNSDINGALIGIFLSGDNNDSANTGLAASQVNLSYSNAGTGGALVSVPLTGTTVDDGYITGTTEPDTGFTLSPGTTDTTTWQLSLAAGAPGSAANDALRLEVDLDQVDASSGATSNLDYDTGTVTAIAGTTTTTTPPITTPTSTTTTIIEPTTTTIEPGSTITKTVIETVPLVAATCTVPKLVGDSPKSTAAALKKANCTSVTQIEPAHTKRQRLVVKTANPKAGTHLPVGGTLTVTFKAVTVKKAARKATRRA